jgi:hypothetical protein
MRCRAMANRLWRAVRNRQRVFRRKRNGSIVNMISQPSHDGRAARTAQRSSVPPVACSGKFAGQVTLADARDHVRSEVN